MKSILDKLGIDETLTKPAPKEKQFTHVKDMITDGDNLNFMCDVLHLPTTKNKNAYLFVCVDLSSNKFDIEPMKNKDSETLLNAYKKCIERKYIKDPKYSIQSDNGPEFMGSFHKYFADKNIFHKMARAYRHKQNSVVESLNKSLGRILNGYMNTKEVETGKVYREWDEITDFVREELNKYRTSKSFKKAQETPEMVLPGYKEKPKFKIGDIVLVKNEVPKNALNNKQPTTNFRVGDYRFSPTPRKIIDIYIYPKPINYRYKVSGVKECSFVASELLKQTKEKVEKWEVKKISDKKTVKGKILYKVLWKGYTVKDATFEPKERLIEDGFKEMIDEFEKELKAKKSKKKKS